MKKTILTLNFCFLSFLMVNCSCKTTPSTSNSSLSTASTATAYKLISNNYVCKATVGVTKDGLISSIELDEAFLPSTYAKVKNHSDYLSDVTKYTYNNTDYYYANEIVIYGETYFGTKRAATDPITSAASSQYVKYSSDNIKDLFLFLSENEENAKWYYEACESNNVYFASTSLISDSYTTEDNKIIFFKSKANYWSDDNSLGWKGNLEEIKKALIGRKPTMQFTMDDKGYWVSDEVKTQATITGFNDYYEVIKMAYNKVVINKAKI